jgi:NitT/TauT family transport system permease protein
VNATTSKAYRNLQRVARLTNRAIRALQIIVTVAAAIFIWQMIVVLGGVKLYILPAPTQVFASALANWRELVSGCFVTVGLALWGLLLSILIGIPLALVLDASDVVRRTFYPLLVATQVVPVIVFAPILVMWFGFSNTPEIIVIVVMCFFPIVVETMTGLGFTTRSRIELARSMGATTLQTFLKIKAPGALPNIFNGLKIAVTTSLVGALVAEFVSSSAGLGRLLLSAVNTLDNALLFAGAFFISVSGILLFAVVEFCERVTIPWHTDRLAENKRHK